MDILEIIRKGLDVEFDEVFSRESIIGDATGIVRYKFNITNSVFTSLSYSICKGDPIWYFLNDSEMLGDFIKNNEEIIREPFKPKFGDRFYYITIANEVSYDNFYKDEEFSLSMYKCGNCYKNAVSAEKDKIKWVNYYKEIQDSLK
jgi:hypothetical protein